ncbi:FecCD family ABC transporter permease [Rhizobium lentis]|uniref:Iron ABC transporter permease n=1 Tax=Rhizobium lentis TaxID=1138194 RepID=A0ABS7IGM3_9HYPH|nr:iron ABC transporter permease [Rhizobium lentis]MBX4957363.1 iron ABC transporter permease [Rhizobium lentis]MBX4975060.1 iron ABC transporter permease [Rhizobium lentis]MBX4987354.1 iron ABC transporter permease [Rhizobium lentis]MBX5005798.1 iron ABC transporter permease [Rhizobium lentis]MBX5027020.1 iron ABC transporter permease [Rhizobium lentis]
MSPRQSHLAIGLVVVAAILAVMLGLLVGAKTLSVETALRVLLAPDGKIESVLVWTLRLPRSLAAVAGGAGLAVSGYILQTLTRNPLADPGITGVTSGAVAPIVCCFVFVPWLSPAFYPFVGLAGGLAAASVTFWVSRGGQGRPLQLALGGVSVSLFLSAITTYVLLLTGPQSASLLFWLAGGFQGRTWSHLFYMLPWTIVGVIGALALRRVIGMFMLSDHAAAGMGLQLGLWKPLILILAVIPVAGVAPVAGPVAFVGLAAPHIARLLRPRGTGFEIGLSVALGALIVTVADIFARSIALPRELPVGIITALIGGPVFIYLVQRGQLNLAGEAR